MSYYKENQNITEYNERVLKDINNFAEYINGDLALKYSIEECQLLQPLVMLLCRYIMYSGLYDDVVFNLETASDIREVVKNARAYFIETSFLFLHSEEPISRRMEEDLINFTFFSIESAGLEHAEKRDEYRLDFKDEDRNVFELIKDLDDDQLKDFEAEMFKEEEQQTTTKSFNIDEWFPPSTPDMFQTFEEYNHDKQKEPGYEEVMKARAALKRECDEYMKSYESEQITQQIMKEIEVGIDTCDTLNDV